MFLFAFFADQQIDLSRVGHNDGYPAILAKAAAYLAMNAELRITLSLDMARPLMTLLPDFREAGPRSRNDPRSTRGRSSRAVSRLLAGSSLRMAHYTAHIRIAGRASCHSPIRISCDASQCEAENGVGAVQDIRRGSAKMIPTIGIAPVSLDLFRRDANVLPVFSSLCVNVAFDVLDFGRVAVRIIATADGRIIGHVPC